MIIRSIFRRYERWNPVHPTGGAFWGVGIGIGCGVGWGPGFGHEVVGYVGAGCGAGFSVGITFFGIGIGLPANYLLHVAQTASMITKRGALEIAGARRRLRSTSFEGDNSGSKDVHSTFMPDMRSLLVSKSKDVTDCMRRVSKHLFPPKEAP